MIPNATTVDLHEKPLKKAEQKGESSDFSEKSHLSHEEIVASVRKRFQKRALRLLKEIEKNPTALSYDSTGEVTIDGMFVRNSNIKDLLASCFYTIRSKGVTGLLAWIDLLKQNNLFSYVSNPDLNQNELPEDWYFIGNMT